MADTIQELVKFLQIGARLDLKAVALEHLLGLTGSDTGIATITQHPALLVSLISLLDDRSIPISKDSALCLVNISANEEAASKLIDLNIKEHCPPLQKPPENIINTLLKFILNPESVIADPCCMILSNLSRPIHLIDKVISGIEESGKSFDDIIDVFVNIEFNKKGAKLDYLGPVLSNLSQSSRFRQHVMDEKKFLIQRLCSFTQYKKSVVRRGGVVGTIKNCCFETDLHDWLLRGFGETMLPMLLLPLAGNEEFDDEDNDKLPLDLQYLPIDKVREDDPDIRCMLLEAITQLCTKRHNREYIRDKNTYVILRELHKWEQDRKALLACENLVDILIRTEDEIGEDNLKEVEVPEHLHDDFKKADEQFLNQ